MYQGIHIILEPSNYLNVGEWGIANTPLYSGNFTPPLQFQLRSTLFNLDLASTVEMKPIPHCRLTRFFDCEYLSQEDLMEMASWWRIVMTTIRQRH